VSNLTDTQLILLSRASQREDGAAMPDAHLRGAVAASLAARLIGLGFMREEPAGSGMPVWRVNDDGDRLALVITPAGLAAICIGHADAGQEIPEAAASSMTEGLEQAASEVTSRIGHKQAQVLDMLQTAKGATLVEIMAAIGWLAHSARAVISGFRKKGYAVERSPGSDGISRYRIGVGESPSTSPADETGEGETMPGGDQDAADSDTASEELI
jgi:hypothetical protein